MAHHGPPVAPAPRQVVSRQRWLAARNSEQRQRESAKRARELMRMRQRDRKIEAGMAGMAEMAGMGPRNNAMGHG